MVVEATPETERTPEPEPLPTTPPSPVSQPVTASPSLQRMPPEVTDLSSYIAWQRRTSRAIGDPDMNAALVDRRGRSADEIENQRRERIVANNLAGTMHQGSGYGQPGGGLFQIKRIGLDDAEFWFAGFNKDMQRRTKQLIEVQKGENADIQIAIVRKMIAIIRGETQGDFAWQSARLGRDLWLSARPAHDQALQETLMRELFHDWSAGARH